MDEPKKFRKKPVVIEAVRWDGPPGIDILTAFGAHVEPDGDWSQDFTLRVWVEPERSWVRCPVGFWIIKGVKDEFYPCDPEVFAATYEPVP